jgi:hypothetical protein
MVIQNFLKLILVRQLNNKYIKAPDPANLKKKIQKKLIKHNLIRAQLNLEKERFFSRENKR